MMRIAAFTGGRTISSARFRVRQYITELRRYDMEMVEYIAPLGAWPSTNRIIRPAWALATLATRLPAVAASWRSDLTFLQRELLSTFRTLEPFTKAPRVLDIDDAVWMTRESQLRRLVECVSGVVCGNDFIDSWASQWHANRVIIPTAVDTDRWSPRSANAVASGTSQRSRIIGWTGLYAGSKYLLSIEHALVDVLNLHPDVTLRVVSDRRPDFRFVPASRIEYIRWSPENEVSTMQDMTVGIMPLHDTPWERGKCSYKMLLYMACGLPVVVSPVGMNRQVLELGVVGLAALDRDEWVGALTALLGDPERAEATGANGRQVVLEHFALRVLALKLAQYFRTFEG
jgi:glycosyltransferase involved in cell wall biosynthesis